MPSSYIPAKDAALDTWQSNFASLITAAPATYGLAAGDAAAINAVCTPWHTAYLAATNGSTRGPATIATKDTARTTMLHTLRPYAQMIANNAAVSPTNKIALGLNPRTNPPSPIAAPTTLPLIGVVAAQSLATLMNFRDSMASPSVKAKPAGAIGMQFFAKNSLTPIIDPTLLLLVGQITKSPFVVPWNPSLQGATVYYAGRWITRRGLVGPYSVIGSTVVI